MVYIHNMKIHVFHVIMNHFASFERRIFSREPNNFFLGLGVVRCYNATVVFYCQMLMGFCLEYARC